MLGFVHSGYSTVDHKQELERTFQIQHLNQNLNKRAFAIGTAEEVGSLSYHTLSLTAFRDSFSLNRFSIIDVLSNLLVYMFSGNQPRCSACPVAMQEFYPVS